MKQRTGWPFDLGPKAQTGTLDVHFPASVAAAVVIVAPLADTDRAIYQWGFVCSSAGAAPGYVQLYLQSPDLNTLVPVTVAFNPAAVLGVWQAAGQLVGGGPIVIVVPARWRLVASVGPGGGGQDMNLTGLVAKKAAGLLAPLDERTNYGVTDDED